METKARQPKRTCPACGHAVHVAKSITPTKDHYHIERLQTLKCSHCPMRGVLTIKEDIIWSNPDLAVTGPEQDRSISAK